MRRILSFIAGVNFAYAVHNGVVHAEPVPNTLLKLVACVVLLLVAGRCK